MNLIVERTTSIELWFLYQSLNFRTKCINVDMMKAIIVVYTSHLTKSLPVYQWWYHFHPSLGWIVIVKFNLELWNIISIYLTLVLGEHIGLRQFFPKFGGVVGWINLKVRNYNTHSKLIKCYVLKKRRKREIQISVCY